MGEPQEFDDLAEFKAYLDERNPRRDRKPRFRPIVQEIGPGPEARKGPECRLCHDTRRLVEIGTSREGEVGYLCRTCVKQVEWDRAKRCVWCGTPAKRRLIDTEGYCGPCAAGVTAKRNLYELVKLRWVGVIRGD